MAASITHLAVGERILNVYYSDAPWEVHSAFLAGCALVDVHGFNSIDRRYTHFVGRVEEDGEHAYLHSCTTFLHTLDSLLRLPQSRLRPEEHSFAAGYLCHLAVDECWKKLGSQLFQRFGIRSWADFPVPADVSVTTYDFMSSKLFLDPRALHAQLEQLVIPDVFLHVPVTLFVRQWNIIREYVFAGGTPEAYLQMLALAGLPAGEIEETRRRYDAHWESSMEFGRRIGGAEPFLEEGVERSMQVLPQLLAGHKI